MVTIIIIIIIIIIMGHGCIWGLSGGAAGGGWGKEEILRGEEDGSTLYIYTYLSIYLSVYLSVCLSICLSMYLSDSKMKPTKLFEGGSWKECRHIIVGHIACTCEIITMKPPCKMSKRLHRTKHHTYTQLASSEQGLWIVSGNFLVVRLHCRYVRCCH
jgi:hypothetical protein